MNISGETGSYGSDFYIRTKRNVKKNESDFNFKEVTHWGRLVQKKISEGSLKPDCFKKAKYHQSFLFIPSRIHFDAVVEEGNTKKVVRMSVKCKQAAKKMGITEFALKELIEKNDFSFETEFRKTIREKSLFLSSSDTKDIHQMERDQSDNGECALGKVGTTSKTDRFQNEGPRNDDHVSFRQLDNRIGIIVETDGASSGKRGSELFSYYLNMNINNSMSMKSEEFLSLSEAIGNESDLVKKKELQGRLQQIVTSIASKAIEEAKKDTENHLKNESLIDELQRAASSLSLVVSVPLSNGNAITFGIQNGNSASVIWDPTTKRFETKSLQRDEKQSLISTKPLAKPEADFFIRTFDGKRVAIAFSDGVWDNLPGVNDEEKLAVLNDIILNPAFDEAVDPEQNRPGFVLTHEIISQVGDGSRDTSENIPPEKIRDRMMNFTFWATADLRERSVVNDLLTKISHTIKKEKFFENEEVDENRYKGLPEEAMQNAVFNEDRNTYTFTKETEVEIIEMDADIYKGIDSELKSKFEKYITVFEDEVFDYPGKKVYFYGGSNIGRDHLKRELEEIDTPGAVTPKTDGVSVVVMSINTPSNIE